jgi:hypothetical protein
MKKTLLSFFVIGIIIINILTLNFPKELFGAVEQKKGTLERWPATDEDGNQIGWVYYCNEDQTHPNCSPIGSYYVIYN